MGTSTSRMKSSSVRAEHIDELVLPASKLRFCGDQLQNLNFIFYRKLNARIDCDVSKLKLIWGKTFAIALGCCVNMELR